MCYALKKNWDKPMDLMMAKSNTEQYQTHPPLWKETRVMYGLVAKQV